MRTYRYYAILSDGEHTIMWIGRATNIKDFRAETEKQFSNLGWKITECRKRPPETRREKKYVSMACVDMGQAAR